MQRSEHLKYRPDIDGLRALAVVSVLIFHAFPNALPGGFIGVDIFFVISGYLITKVITQEIDRSTFTIGSFYSRRIRRIFPGLLLVIPFCLLVGWLGLVPTEFLKLGQHAVAGATFVSNFVLWREAGYFDEASELKPLLHLWSLAIEEQFYIFWPLILIGISKWTWNGRPLALPLTLLFIVLSFVLNVFALPINPVAAFYSPLCRFWEILFGSALCLSQSHPVKGSTTALLLSLTGLLLIAFGLAYVSASHFPGWWGLPPVIGATLIIAAGPQSPLNRLVLGNKLAVGIGLISYPLYLWHWPVLFAIRNLQLRAATPKHIIAGLGITFLLAWLTYRLVEKPFRANRAATKKAVGLAAGMAIVAAIGIWIVQQQGVPWRLPKVIVQMVSGVDEEQIKRQWRDKDCFLGTEESVGSYNTSICVDKNPPESPMVLLWGDSNAAALVPGVLSLQRTQPFRFAQFTMSLCPPILQYEVERRPTCIGNNDFVLSQISKLRPKVVVLHAQWGIYEEALPRLEKTFARLKAAGTERIVLMGPAPIWMVPLPSLLFAYYRARPREILPSRLSDGLWEQNLRVDQQLRALSEKQKIAYFSTYDVFCNQQGCLTLMDNSDVTTFDTVHLTPKASALLLQQLHLELFFKP
jgi:peptidoglycan/LPS O-acetylase OafA/YrhL